MGRPSFITEKLLEIVTWEYQALEDLYKLLIPMVPPGRALRQYEVRLRGEAKKRGFDTPPPRVRRPLTETEQIHSGARDIVRASINAQVDGGYLERLDQEDGTILIRRRDRRQAAPVVRDQDGACKECGRPFVKGREKTRPPVAAQVITIMDLLHARERRLGREAK